jgi:hypothetical protein
MNRDMDLIRLLLKRGAGYDVAAEIEKYPVPVRAFHIALLKDAGYVIALVTTDEQGQPAQAVTSRLTWQGYDFLQLMLDDGVWNKAKKLIIDKGIPWTGALLYQWLKAEARRHIPGLGGEASHEIA